MKQKAYWFLTWKSKFAPTGGCGYVICAFYLIMCLCRQYVAKICKTLYASISTAHKAYLETSVSVVVGVVKKHRSHQKHCGGMGLASYPGRVGGEKWPGIDCLRMRDHSQKTVGNVLVRYISVSSKGAAICWLNYFQFHER